MSDVVIRAENLGKKYTIGHQAVSGRYLALRDVVVENARTFWRKTSDLIRGKDIVQGTTLEEVWALRDVNFEVQRGEAMGIIGRNGAGKTTLLKILSRITESSAGRVTIKGRVASLLEVGTGFHPELTGRENIYLNGAILGMTRAEIKRKFDEIVAFAEVEKFLDTPVKRYSSGMYVRLAFAVAAHLEPEILLVDEVLAVGDAEFQKKCLGKMGEVAKEGRTVLFVSHQMGSIKGLCPKAIWLNDGHIQNAGIASEIIGAYLRGNSDLVRAERLWQAGDAPGDQSIRLLAVRLCQPPGSLSNLIDITEPMEIEVEISIISKSIDVNITLEVTAQDGNTVLVTCDLFAKNYQERSPGRWSSVCYLPAHTLNTGIYYLSAYGDIPNVQVLFREYNVLSWRVEATDQLMNRYGMDQWPGVIGPGAAKWRMNRCN